MTGLGRRRRSAAGPDLSRDLARYYDLDLSEDDPGDLALYRTLARRAGGDLLELGVGTGRLAVPLALEGFAVTGVDSDPGRLERAALRWQAEGAHTQGSLELVEGDLLELNLGRRFGLVFFALNGLLELGTRERQLAAFRSMARHLAPAGLAAVDVSLPSPEDLALYDGRPRLEWVRDDGETGLRVAKVLSATREPATSLVEIRTRFDAWSDREGRVLRAERVGRLRLVQPEELVALSSEAGLAPRERYATYDGSPFSAGADRIVLVAGLV